MSKHTEANIIKSSLIDFLFNKVQRLGNGLRDGVAMVM